VWEIPRVVDLPEPSDSVFYAKERHPFEGGDFMQAQATGEVF